MSAWKRWSWPYRVGVLLTLMVMLQGFIGCPLPSPSPPSYDVPGVSGKVVGERQTASDGRRYYGVEWIDTNRNLRQRIVYEGSREYELIEQFFRNLNNPVAAGDRSSIPGGSGPPPPPPVQ